MDNSLISLAELKTDRNIWYKIQVFLYDLRYFEQSNVSQCRLKTVVDPSYLGEPYFNPDEAEKVKRARLAGDKTLSALIEETLNERLERRIKKRVESDDYRVCAAHDVAPILEKALGIKPKDLESDQVFFGYNGDKWPALEAWRTMGWNWQATEDPPQEKRQEKGKEMTSRFVGSSYVHELWHQSCCWNAYPRECGEMDVLAGTLG